MRQQSTILMFQLWLAGSAVIMPSQLHAQWAACGAGGPVQCAPSGNVGIGTTTPIGALHVNNGYFYQTANVNGSGVSSSFVGGGLAIGWNRLAGTGETGFITNRGAGTGGFQFTDFNNSVYTNLMKMSLVSISGGGADGGFSFYDRNTQLMRILKNGNVGIGTTAPAHLLHVAGTIGAQEIIVSSTGADYVFDPGYQLRPLKGRYSVHPGQSPSARHPISGRSQREGYERR